ncbi:MAG: hypothetical protein BJ554DRAFT_1536 [Olpidium bornovanus]|uniref:Uncharacterized protein n=1 Tax=Olpidium bornovanus TaxID=278681 RepID=A0A8H8A191_9FUNG|nr:MAG: hypothetical protein BJ554DRAFT_1536 [Olpidium bornovanus]
MKVDCKFDTSLYTSGRCFMASLPSLVAPAPRTPYSKFKLDSGLAGASGAVRVKPVVAIPRHNPDAENALIMPKPSAAHELLWNKKKRPVTDVIIDPILCVHLRPHQREGVKFLYECVMGYKEYDGCGAILADEMYVAF